DSAGLQCRRRGPEFSVLQRLPYRHSPAGRRLDAKAARLGPGTAYDVRLIFEARILPILSDVRVDAITVERVENLVAAFRRGEGPWPPAVDGTAKPKRGRTPKKLSTRREFLGRIVSGRCRYRTSGSRRRATARRPTSRRWSAPRRGPTSFRASGCPPRRSSACPALDRRR